MDFHKLVNKLYEIEPSDVRHIDINALKPAKVIDEVGPDLINESYEIRQGSLKEGIPSDLSSFLRLAGAPVTEKNHFPLEKDSLIVTDPAKNSSATIASSENPADVIRLDIPLFIRLLEYAREDAKTDVDLHNVSERVINLSSSGETLTMDDYDSIVPHTSTQEAVKQRLDPKCWKGYKKSGTKIKNNTRVNNCVKEDSIRDYLLAAYKEFESKNKS